ncbi:hypothetical protein [Streptomyces erythrochromogenes]|uniref:hypothetical protein n=1 Tax=Streptomyces erythrochromogenes TaxID=285574 RepID=UPI0033E63562
MRVSAAVVMQMHRDGYSDQQIADQTGADLAAVAEIIDTHRRLVDRGDIPKPAERPPAPDALALLAWGTGHKSAAVRQYADRALTALELLKARQEKEAEAERIDQDVARLEKRLAGLRERRAELKGTRAKSRPATVLDYPAAEVRAWARQAGVDCPPVGRVPKPVLAQWRAATGQAQP